MTEYKAFSNTVVVFKEPTVSQIVPKSGRYYGKESSAKRMAAGIKEGMMLEVRGDVSTREFTGKNGKQMQENVLTAKGIAVSLNQPGLKIDYSRPKAKEQEAER